MLDSLTPQCMMLMNHLINFPMCTYSVDHKSSKELRQYLANVAEQCENNAADLPSVIILDNLHHAASLGDVFNGFLNAKYNKCPYIIGTMNQATCSTTNLQLHHNFRSVYPWIKCSIILHTCRCADNILFHVTFRWILCANHMEPVKGFLGRYLRRKLLEAEAREGSTNPDMARVLDWIPKVWQQLNKFLESHSSSDVTIGKEKLFPYFSFSLLVLVLEVLAYGCES